jgi:UDP-3-O-[3-hydroxymyristoyl] glucosamine N-acyltransferase
MELTNRQKFCLKMREFFRPSINVVLPQWVRIGRNVHIEQNVVFSYHGLGAEKIKDEWLLIPHAGHILIGDNVTILDSAIIMRATKTVTSIGPGSIIGVKAHIGHNVYIGPGCLIGSGCLIGGSVIIEKDVEIGAGAIIRNKVKIGKGAKIGLGAVVVKDVKEGETVAGCPAKPLTKKELEQTDKFLL